MPSSRLRRQPGPVRWSAALLVLLLCVAATRSLAAQTWGSHGVRVYQRPSAFNLLGYAGTINDSGQVAGTLGAQAAVLTPGGGTTPLGTLGGLTSIGYGINDAAQVTGGSYLRGDTIVHAFLHDGTTMYDLGTLGGRTSWGSGINDAGQVTGFSEVGSDAAQHAFLYDGGMHDLGTLGGDYSWGSGINAAGYVAGSSFLSGDAFQHAFFYDGSLHDLGTLGGSSSNGSAINDAGEVTGGAGLRGDATFHAFLYDGGMLDLGTLGGAYSYGYDVSEGGLVVGVATDAGDVYRAALWESRGGRYRAFSLADIVNRGGSADWRFEYARAISDDGTHVVAWGENASVGYSGWVVLEQSAVAVTPEPVSLLLLGTGLVALGGLRRRSGGARPRSTGSGGLPRRAHAASPDGT